MRRVNGFVLLMILVLAAGCTFTWRDDALSPRIRWGWESYEENHCHAYALPASGVSGRGFMEALDDWRAAHREFEVAEWRVFVGPPQAVSHAWDLFTSAAWEAEKAIRDRRNPWLLDYNVPLGSGRPIYLGGVFVYCPNSKERTAARPAIMVRPFLLQSSAGKVQ